MNARPGHASARDTPRACARVLELLLPMSLCASVAHAGPDLERLSADWQAACAARAHEGLLEFELSSRELATLAQGDIVRQRIRIAGGDRVNGAIWTDRDPDSIWISILDDTDDTLVRGLFEQQLPGTRPGRKTLYQRLDFPWPFHDRQWVIEITNNRALWDLTDGAVWERTWTLADPTRAIAPTPDALWVPVNEGGWMLAEAAGGILLVYQARTTIGGSVPDEVVTRWAMATLDEMLGHIIARAHEIPAHYDALHTPLFRPDDSPIAPGSL